MEPYVAINGVVCRVETYDVMRPVETVPSPSHLWQLAKVPAVHHLVAIMPDGERIERVWRDGDETDVTGPYIPA